MLKNFYNIICSQFLSNRQQAKSLSLIPAALAGVYGSRQQHDVLHRRLLVVFLKLSA